ncbi:uncharacterized protein LTHEOB_11517 [Lasiodiplodia theobromae]|uniref:uncharacterized protein n=1 Tax=Lasiodiplodia theobromae TaxID=45133 RepID=UPI0015C32C3E|nr:uncharacterized protein LTHEOB_11517 [Lasiodiplodia theobromae]KAF4537139.1 hypothetical protein LTHEOB_11517 [Lasiodiplodia theobromae]
MRPSFSFDTVDLLANRNSLRKLFDFACDRAPDNFRIDLSLVGNTLVMTRRERSLKQKIKRTSSDGGWGHNFEFAFTEAAPGLEDANGHHRAVQYRLGNINCLIQCEVDAWCDDGATDEEETPEALLNNLSLSDPVVPAGTTSVHSQSCRSIPATIHAGHDVPASKLAEIKTVGRKPLSAAIVKPQLWFGRTPYLITGSHEQGNFITVAVKNDGANFTEWEQCNQEALRKLVGLIEQLRSFAQRVPGGVCAVTCNKTVKPLRLDVFAPTARMDRVTVPREFVELFWGKK